MISLCTLLPDMPESCPSAVRIAAQKRIFDGTALADFYVQTVGDKTTALLSCYAGGSTLYAGEAADFRELSEFVAAVSHSLFTEAETAERLDLPRGSSGKTLVLDNHGTGEGRAEAVSGYDSFRDIYRLLSGSFGVAPFEIWYADVFRGIQTGAQMFFCACAPDGTPASCAALTALTDSSAILAGITTAPDKRGCGYAGKAIKRALSAAGDRRVFAMIREDSLIGFYEKFGFTSFGEWSETEI